MHIESCILIMISGMAYVSLHRVDNFDSSISCVCFCFVSVYGHGHCDVYSMRPKNGSAHTTAKELMKHPTHTHTQFSIGQNRTEPFEMER